MGYEIARFVDDIDEELTCLICKGVLENPAQAPDCEHAFCRECISEWLSRQSSCPVDRSFTLISYLQPVPRIIKNLLNKLLIRCENASHGCVDVLRLESLHDHQANCTFNPKRPVTCENCNLVVPKDVFPTHNCVKELRKLYEECLNRINMVESQIQMLRSERTNQDDNSRTYRSEIRTNPVLVNTPIGPANNEASQLTAVTQRQTNPTVPLIPALPAPIVNMTANNTDNLQLNSMADDVIRWVNALPIARVTRWGGMISTPDLVLQAVIRRALAESGCPLRILEELMTNAHERCWPSGLHNLETRQVNRGYYESYICRRVPGRQAVVMMASDNRHMASHMVTEPGIKVN
ncbi:hypothetical protein GJ496_005613 [Pomphorhynchus laevis]|nr:hypothetical protein GJ496_005613 [Pomphorhynchus laevis]